MTRRPLFPLRVQDWMILLVAAAGFFGVVQWQRQNFARVHHAGQRMMCLNNLKLLALALHAYNDAWGCLPPSVTTNATGRPMHSWRTLILPYLDSTALASQYHLDEPWNGPKNAALRGVQCVFFECPSGLHAGSTSYFAVTGPGTCFPGPNQSARLEDFTGSGRPMPFLVVESLAKDVPWIQPGDLAASEIRLVPDDLAAVSISSLHESPNAVYPDSRAIVLNAATPPETMRDGLPRAGDPRPVDPHPKRP